MTDEHYNLILFISGMSVKSSRALENIRQICDEYPARKIKLQIIDISKEREKATQYQVFALPTLIRTEPAPKRTILGDLSDKEKVLKILDIS